MQRFTESILVLGFAWLLSPLQASDDPSFPARNPGKVFESKRAALVARFDRNGDQILDAAERNAMRLARKGKSQRQTNRRGPEIPPEFLEKYDKDNDGELSRPEWESLWPIEAGLVLKEFDADSDGELNEKEKKSLGAAIGKGKFPGVRRWIAGSLLQDPEADNRRRQRDRVEPYLKRSHGWLSFDRDGDGIADPDELESIRAGTNGAEQTKASPAPSQPSAG